MTEKEFGIVEWWLREAMEYGEERHNEPYEKAIKALEEIQQYKAMEEKLNGISVKEVVDGFISAVEKETCEGYERGRILTNEDAEKWNAYREIGTVEEVKELKEKATPKKVQYDEYGKEEGYPYCECGKCLIDDFVGTTYCPDCGQKLDWEGGE